MKASFVALLLAQECHIHFLRHVTSRSRTKAVQLAVAPVCQLGLVVGLDGAPTGSSGAGHGNSLARNGDSPPARRQHRRVANSSTRVASSGARVASSEHPALDHHTPGLTSRPWAFIALDAMNEAFIALHAPNVSRSSPAAGALESRTPTASEVMRTSTHWSLP